MFWYNYYVDLYGSLEGIGQSCFDYMVWTWDQLETNYGLAIEDWTDEGWYYTWNCFGGIGDDYTEASMEQWWGECGGLGAFNPVAEEAEAAARGLISVDIEASALCWPECGDENTPSWSTYNTCKDNSASNFMSCMAMAGVGGGTILDRNANVVDVPSSVTDDDEAVNNFCISMFPCGALNWEYEVMGVHPFGEGDSDDDGISDAEEYVEETFEDAYEDPIDADGFDGICTGADTAFEEGGFSQYDIDTSSETSAATDCSAKGGYLSDDNTTCWGAEVFDTADEAVCVSNGGVWICGTDGSTGWCGIQVSDEVLASTVSELFEYTIGDWNLALTSGDWIIGNIISNSETDFLASNWEFSVTSHEEYAHNLGSGKIGVMYELISVETEGLVTVTITYDDGTTSYGDVETTTETNYVKLYHAIFDHEAPTFGHYMYPSATSSDSSATAYLATSEVDSLKAAYGSDGSTDVEALILDNVVNIASEVSSELLEAAYTFKRVQRPSFDIGLLSAFDVDETEAPQTVTVATTTITSGY